MKRIVHYGNLEIAGSCLFKVLKLKSKQKRTEKLDLLEIDMTIITICYQFSIDYLYQTTCSYKMISIPK
jgi:hypothetical protein